MQIYANLIQETKAKDINFTKIQATMLSRKDALIAFITRDLKAVAQEEFDELTLDFVISSLNLANEEVCVAELKKLFDFGIVAALLSEISRFCESGLSIDAFDALERMDVGCKLTAGHRMIAGMKLKTFCKLKFF